MIYGNDLKKLIKEEKNIINRMYLNEILLQYRKLEEVFNQEADDYDSYYDSLAAAMTSFTDYLESKRYNYNRTSKIGLKKSSPVLSSSYLDDLLSTIVKRQSILTNKGVEWGKQPFSMDLMFAPESFCAMEKDPNFCCKDSPYFNQISQKIDLQVRATGRKKLSKITVTLPLLIFIVHKKLHSEDMIRIEYYARKAKETFSKSKLIVICETLDVNFSEESLDPSIDVIFILRKRKAMRRNGTIHADVIKALSERINSYLYEQTDEENNYKDTGIIE